MLPIGSFLYNEKPYRLKDAGAPYEIPVIRYDHKKGVDKSILIPVKRESILGPAYIIWLSNGVRIDTSNLRIMIETPINPDFDISVMLGLRKPSIGESSLENKGTPGTKDPNMTRSFDLDNYSNQIVEVKNLKKGNYIVLSNGWAHSYIMHGREGMAVKEIENLYASHQKYDSRLFTTFQEANDYAKGLLMRRMDVQLEKFGDCWSVSIKSTEIIKAVSVDRVSYEGDIFHVPVVEVMAREYDRVFVCCDIFYVEVKGLLVK